MRIFVGIDFSSDFIQKINDSTKEMEQNHKGEPLKILF